MTEWLNWTEQWAWAAQTPWWVFGKSFCRQYLCWGYFRVWNSPQICWWGSYSVASQESQSSASWFQQKVSMYFCSAWSCHPPPGWWPQLLQMNLELCLRLLCVLLDEELGPCLIAAPLFPDSLSFVPMFPLISDYLNLPFGTQGSSRKLKLFFPQIRN